MWVRGLKLDDFVKCCFHNVAPYVGAWIETPESSHNMRCLLSHPMWVRGLKHDKTHTYNKVR